MRKDLNTLSKTIKVSDRIEQYEEIMNRVDNLRALAADGKPPYSN